MTTLVTILALASSSVALLALVAFFYGHGNDAMPESFQALAQLVVMLAVLGILWSQVKP